VAAKKAVVKEEPVLSAKELKAQKDKLEEIRRKREEDRKKRIETEGEWNPACISFVPRPLCSSYSLAAFSFSETVHIASCNSFL
jgi:hypothetical protein